MLDVRDSGKNDGPERFQVFRIPVDVIVTQLCQKIQKNLVVGRRIDFINNENDGLRSDISPIQQDVEEIAENGLVRPPEQSIDTFFDFHRNTLIPPKLSSQQPAEFFNKGRLIRKTGVADSLKACADDNILIL